MSTNFKEVCSFTVVVAYINYIGFVGCVIILIDLGYYHFKINVLNQLFLFNHWTTKWKIFELHGCFYLR